jgi:hypothetical protein
MPTHLNTSTENRLRKLIYKTIFITTLSSISVIHARNALITGESLTVGETLTSANENYTFVIEQKRLIVKNKDKIVWESSTCTEVKHFEINYYGITPLAIVFDKDDNPTWFSRVMQFGQAGWKAYLEQIKNKPITDGIRRYAPSFSSDESAQKAFTEVPLYFVLDDDGFVGFFRGNTNLWSSRPATHEWDSWSTPLKKLIKAGIKGTMGIDMNQVERVESKLQ